jgi:hypothetical protein
MDAAGEIVERWLDDNGDVIRGNGGYGDIQTLLAVLWASWKNAE